VNISRFAILGPLIEWPLLKSRLARFGGKGPAPGWGGGQPGAGSFPSSLVPFEFRGGPFWAYAKSQRRGPNRSEEIHDSHEKICPEDGGHYTCIGSGGMVGERANSAAGRVKPACATEERHANRNRGLQGEGRPLPGGRQVGLSSVRTTLLLRALLESTRQGIRMRPPSGGFYSRNLGQPTSLVSH